MRLSNHPTGFGPASLVGDAARSPQFLQKVVYLAALLLGRHAVGQLGQQQFVDLPPPDVDTMVASFCAVGAARRHNLDDLALRFFDLQKIPTTALIGTGKSQITMAEVPVEVTASPLYGVAMLKIAMELKKADARALDEVVKSVLDRMHLPEADFRQFLASNGGLLRTIALKKRY